MTISDREARIGQGTLNHSIRCVGALCIDIQPDLGATTSLTQRRARAFGSHWATQAHKTSARRQQSRGRFTRSIPNHSLHYLSQDENCPQIKERYQPERHGTRGASPRRCRLPDRNILIRLRPLSCDTRRLLENVRCRAHEWSESDIPFAEGKRQQN